MAPKGSFCLKCLNRAGYNMNIPCAVSGLMYALRPPFIAPICVLNIRSIVLTSDHLDSLHVGHSIPADKIATSSSGARESVFS